MTRSALFLREARQGTEHSPIRPLAARARPRSEPAARRPDYRSWSIEELRALAHQLQLPEASRKTRSELLRIFDVSAA